MKLALAFLILLSGCRAGAPVDVPLKDYVPCLMDVPRQAERAREIQALVKADQDARGNWSSLSRAQLNEAVWKDEARRKRVAEIFAEGCFKTAADYAAAALVFQHGNSPDHFYQTFQWSKRAVELGDPKSKSLMAAGLDRYLVNLGEKQVFGTQASKPAPEGCWCLEQTETSFPDAKRLAVTGKTLRQHMEWANSLNESGKCKPQYCTKKLKPARRGVAPGYW